MYVNSSTGSPLTSSKYFRTTMLLPSTIGLEISFLLKPNAVSKNASLVDADERAASVGRYDHS